MARVIVGLSGGVDSSVAAYLLKQQGHEVIGLFMKNWHDDSVTISDDCPWLEDSNDALAVAEKLEIPFQTLDLSEEYKTRIVDYMFREYEAGRTPNPDVLCNREIKFDVFLEKALQLKADFVATGHYVRKDSSLDQEGTEVHHLIAGKDGNKDQSYFLCQLSQEQLKYAMFPIGELTKPEVRQIAAEQDLITAGKKDSQGLCFIGKVRLPDFLQQQLLPKTGNIVEIPADSELYKIPELAGQKSVGGLSSLLKEATPISYQPTDGTKVGEHQGAHYFTIGQRKGLNVGGKPFPLFVLATDTVSNTIYVGMGDDHPGLYRKSLFVEECEIHWIRKDLQLSAGEEMSVLARIRYRQPLQPATLIMKEEGLYVQFDQPQKGITPGQFVAWHVGEEVLGSGVISQFGPSV